MRLNARIDIKMAVIRQTENGHKMIPHEGESLMRTKNIRATKSENIPLDM